MKRILVKGVKNSSQTPLSDLGLGGKMIKRVWTVIHEEELKDLDNAVLKHAENVFFEDRNHDWLIAKGNFHYFSRICEAGEEQTLLFECEE